MTVAALKQNVILDQKVGLEDFFVLLSFVTGRSKAFLLAHEEYSLNQEQTTLLESLLKRRALHEPTSYLIGTREFFGRDFLVTPAVLIPRPETELLIEQVLSQMETNTAPTTLIDIGTGSGAIILTLSLELALRGHHYDYLGIDISPEALRVATENKKKLQDTAVTFLQSDLLVAIPETSWTDTVIILANLPYVSAIQYREAMPDVVLYEPALALISGADGLDHYRRLITELRAKKKPSSLTLYLEIDALQTIPIRKLLEESFPDGVCEVWKDLAGHERLIRYTL